MNGFRLSGSSTMPMCREVFVSGDGLEAEAVPSPIARPASRRIAVATDKSRPAGRAREVILVSLLEVPLGTTRSRDRWTGL